MAKEMPTNPPGPGPEGGPALLPYQSADGQARIEVRPVVETLWRMQNQMAELFQGDKPGISLYLAIVYDNGGLVRQATVARFATVRQEGTRQVRREQEYHDLEPIISVGYRVNSLRGTQFRIGATQWLREYLVKGFVLGDDRLKAAGAASGGNYFDELLARTATFGPQRRSSGGRRQHLRHQHRLRPAGGDLAGVLQGRPEQDALGRSRHTAAEIISQRGMLWPRGGPQGAAIV
jgi:hypothetical protein